MPAAEISDATKQSGTEDSDTRRLACTPHTICVIDATPQGEHPRAMPASTMLHLSIVNQENCNNLMASNLIRQQSRVESVRHAS